MLIMTVTCTLMAKRSKTNLKKGEAMICYLSKITKVPIVPETTKTDIEKSCPIWRLCNVVFLKARTSTDFTLPS